MDLQDWLALIEAEYRESPGLSLTKAQARRLWGLDPGTCDALMAASRRHSSSRAPKRTATSG